MTSSFLLKLVEGTRTCIRKICDKLSGRRRYRYTPVNLMRSEIEIETLLEEELDEDLPQVRFIPPPPKPDPDLFTLDAIDSFGNVTSFDINNAVKTMTESEMFYSCEEVSSESEEDDDPFKVLVEEREIDFFQSSKVL